MLTSIEQVVTAALAEDAPWGDITSETFIPKNAQLSGRIIAREPGVFSGQALFDASFRQPGLTVA